LSVVAADFLRFCWPFEGVAEDRAFFAWFFGGEFVVIDGRDVVLCGHIFGL
jgi:hypothetical protein